MVIDLAAALCIFIAGCIPIILVENTTTKKIFKICTAVSLIFAVVILQYHIIF